MLRHGLPSRMAQQRRRVFDAVHVQASLKLLKKHGAHPDVLRGRDPEASAVNEGNLPALERFIADYTEQAKRGSSGAGAPTQRITLHLLTPDGEGTRMVASDVSLAWPLQRVKRALATFFAPIVAGLSEGRDARAVEGNDFIRSLLAAGAGGADAGAAARMQVEVLPFDRYVAKAETLRLAKHLQGAGKKIELEIRRAETKLDTFHKMVASRDGDGDGDGGVSDAEYLLMLHFLGDYLGGRRGATGCRIHVSSPAAAESAAAPAAPTVVYSAAHGAADQLGCVTLPARLLREEDETPETHRPNFANWVRILDSVDWPRLRKANDTRAAAYRAYWSGMEKACKGLAASLGVQAATCRSIGPLLVTPQEHEPPTLRDVREARAALGVAATAHDFVAAVAGMVRGVARGDSPLCEWRAEGDTLAKLYKRGVRLVLKPTREQRRADDDGTSGAVVLAGSSFDVLHTGDLVVYIAQESRGDDIDVKAVSQEVASALRRGAMKAAVCKAMNDEAEAMAASLAKSTGVTVSPDTAWMHSTGDDFLAHYHACLKRLSSSRGRLRALRVTDIRLCVGHDYAFCRDTGLLTIPADFRFSEAAPRVRLPSATHRISAS